MIKFIFKSVLLLSFGLLSTGLRVAPEDKILFSIGRSKDANEIYYSLNLDKYNRLNAENPIQVYWIKRTRKSKIVPLTWIQQKFAYGIVYLSKSENYAKFRLAAYDKRVFELKKNKNNEFRVFTMSNNVEVEVDRVFIYITGGTFWIPKIPKVELYATLSRTDKKIKETIIP
ncbi:DUF4833 domain-containing protein [Labilibaculum antarcticum]|uniref:DUF4833 domain-containing protein n=1 Tax=Labilibaculum antarcticum TaxID=1717717 RepID=A0A1Y1CNB6_9BACT|nr:DUF4833 domain-containing protein [Labilibaculum antarcticum]BAX81764.1 hypothetical protein ALGA_3466 [Labilibaculum antarcticum]